MKPLLPFFTLITGLMLILNCSSEITTPNEPPLNEEAVSVQFSFTKPAHIAHLVNSGIAIVSASDMDSIVQELTVTDSSVNGLIEEIPAGNDRKFEILIYDANEVLTYSGEAYSDIEAGAVVTLNITLYPVNTTGAAIIVGTFASEPPQEFALLFNGDNSWVTIGDRDALEFGTADFTLSAWFRTDETGIQQQIIRKGWDNRTLNEGRWVLKVHSNNVIKVVLDDINNSLGSTFAVEGTTIVTDGEWHHVAAVFDRDAALRIYLDGSLEAEDAGLTAHSASIYNNDEINVYIGRANGEYQIFNGRLDEIQVWGKARTQAEIQQDMNRHLSGNEPGLIAYWQMNEGDGQAVQDLAGENHGYRGSLPVADDNDPEWVVTEFPY